jgi:hypothetical protein
MDVPSIKEVTVPPETYGVYRYSGSTDLVATAAANHELLHRLEASGWPPTGQPGASFYDPARLLSHAATRLR